MKTLITLLIITTLAFSAFASTTTSIEDESFKDKAFKVLLDNVEHVKLVGDVKKVNELKSVFNELGEIISYAFGSLLGGHDEDEKEPRTQIDKFDYTCSEQGSCLLIIDNKSGEKVRYSFNVKINEKMQPVAILNNQVIVRRSINSNNRLF